MKLEFDRKKMKLENHGMGRSRKTPFTRRSGHYHRHHHHQLPRITASEHPRQSSINSAGEIGNDRFRSDTQSKSRGALEGHLYG